MINGFCQLFVGWKGGGTDMFFKKLKQLKRITDYDELLASSEIIRNSHKRCRQRRINAYLTQMPKVLTDHLDTFFGCFSFSGFVTHVPSYLGFPQNSQKPIDMFPRTQGSKISLRHQCCPLEPRGVCYVDREEIA